MKSKLIIAHVSVPELASFDLLQGGASFDEETGLREYSKLEPLFNDERFLEILDESFKEIEENGGDITNALNDIKSYVGDQKLEFVDAPGDSNPEIMEIASLGNEEDSKLCIMPENMADTLSKYLGYKENEKTGLREFFLPALIGGIGSVLSGIGSAVGAGLGAIGTAASSMLAVPAAIGSAASKFFAGGMIPKFIGGGLLNMMMGQKPGRAFGQSALSHVLPAGLSYLDSTLGDKLPISDLLSGMGFSNQYDTELNAIDPSTLSPTQLAEYKKHKSDPSYRKQATFNSLADTLLARNQLMDVMKEDRKRREIQREKIGELNRQMNPYNAINFDQAPVGKMPTKYIPYKKGGKVEGLMLGHSDGQADNKPVDLDEGDFIVNATVVSGLGSGNTLAGKKKLDEFITSLPEVRAKRSKRKVPALISDGEYRIPYHKVAAIGKGNLDRGVKHLNKLQRNVMKNLSKADGSLPKKAKSIIDYIGVK